MNKVRVLVVDDEWNMRNLLRIYLAKNGFEVTDATNGEEALEWIGKQSFDLVVLDVMMPNMDGWQVCSKIRETENIPILMLTARTETKDKVHGLRLGADDYLTKPFDPEELVARVFALLRRSRVTETDDSQARTILHPDLKIDLEGRKVLVKNKPVEFTPKEFDLLYVLAANPQRVFTRDNLLERIWDLDYLGDVRTIDTHVKNVREKVRRAGLSYVPIQTVWGVGYKFQEPEDSR
ncbi:response regulator transcription factor [Effusibacillus dendaii]|uniref:histidine kinase n=1 Tax=Effusibacillus dendaii TaxID=2743772 RepID=A0A7I8DE21_9BACL|nr:response regulator transcription factor [Effusibacillus dendaii]BCJ88355.1 DNA-binding response regulator [Effusibacillus dendaii]